MSTYRRKFGDWEAEFDEKLIYPSLVLLESSSPSLLPASSKLSVGESLAPIKLKSEPRKWKYCQSLKKERNEKREAGSASLPRNMRSVFSKDSANGRAEILLREDIRQRYLQRIGRGNKPGQKSTHLFHVCIAAVKSSKNNNLAPMSPSNRCIRKITEKSSDLDIYEYLSSPEKLYLPKKDKTLEQSLTAKHRDLMAPLSHSYTDLEGDKGDPLMEGILAFRISRDLRLLENSEHENTVTKTAPALDSSALADEKKAKSQSSQFLLDIGRAKRALHFSFTGSLPPSHSSASNPDRISRSSSSSHQRSNEGGMASSTLDVSFEQQRAQDRLLVSQVHRGVIPIQLFRSSSSSSSSCCALDIPNFSIGDDHGLCIGESLAGFDSIQSINISNNRLSCVSLPQIISQISTKSLLFLDISSNKLGDKGCRALSSFFQLPNALSNLNISSCLLSNSNLSRLFSALGSRKQTLVGLNISSNAINIEGTESIKRYLMTDLCSMQSLNLSWNELGSGGGKLIAEALKKNTSLLSLDLSANGIPDDAGQIIISHLSSPTCTLQDLNLSRNKIGSRTCFVLAKICRHRMNALQKINLSCNPLGEPGARVLLREALSGTSLQILLHDVAVDIDDSAFNYSHPELKSPYDLNLLDAYDAAVLDELITMSKRNSSTKFEHVASRDTLKTPFEINIHLLTVNEEVVVKSSLQKWIPPSIGYIRINFSHRIRVPSLAMAVPASSFATLLEIIIQAPSAADRNKFMRLIFMDIFCTTAHLQTFLSSLKRAKLLRSGEISKFDVFLSAWSRIIDGANIFPLVFEHFTREERKELARALSYEQYRFSWENATGNYSLNLSNPAQYNVMLQLAAINTVESEFAKARRGDTSQRGNWYNFRNERYNSEEITIDSSFLHKVPRQNRISFDYVSTTRPSKAKVATISAEELSEMLYCLGLNRAKKLLTTELAFMMMELQLASAKYYFLIKDVLNILEACLSAFDNDTRIYAKVIVAVFSRIYDLHNFDLILRQLSAEACNEVARRLGWLNILNPLKPSQDFVLPMKYLDNRIIIVMLLELSGNEGSEQIRMAPQTDISLVNLYGKIGRIITITNWTETTSMTYCEFGEKTDMVAWQARKDLVKRFLIGTPPQHPDLFRVVDMYAKLEEAGALGVGSIDLQYDDFLLKQN